MREINFYVPLTMTITGNLLYHMFQKWTSKSVDPFVALTATFLAAAVMCGFVAALHHNLNMAGMAQINWASFAVAATLPLIDGGFLLAYRMGWKLNVTQISSNVAVSVLLVPVAYVFFREEIGIRSIGGIVLCLAGLALLTRG